MGSKMKEIKKMEELKQSLDINSKTYLPKFKEKLKQEIHAKQ